MLIPRKYSVLHDAPSERVVSGPQAQQSTVRIEKRGVDGPRGNIAEVGKVSKTIGGAEMLPDRIVLQVRVKSFAGAAQV